MAKPGPKLIKIDWNKAYDLARAQCTQDEISGYFGMTRSQLHKRFKDEIGGEFDTLWEVKKESGKAELRSKQFEEALKGNNTLLIWVGKQILGQKDEQRVFNSVSLHQQLVDEIEKEKKKEQK